MPAIRIVATLVLALLFAVANATMNAPAPNDGVVPKRHKEAQSTIGLVLDTTSLEKTIREVAKDEGGRPDPRAKEKADNDKKIAQYTEELAVYTKNLANYTSLLALITLAVAGIGFWQGKQLKRTVDTAVIEAQPVLSPYVLEMEQLHKLVPLGTIMDFAAPQTFTSKILASFENYGKTPAMIRRVQADLFLTLNDQLPSIDYDKLPERQFEGAIPGETYHADLADRSAFEVDSTVTVKYKEFNELLAEAENDGDSDFRRFFLIGIVVFDDFYGMRHERRFCLKMRFSHTVRFQAQKGGMKYNSSTREKIPKEDPLKWSRFGIR